LVFQWLRNGVPIAGARIDAPNALPVTYILEVPALTDDQNRYSVEVSNDLGRVVSTEGRLTVLP